MPSFKPALAALTILIAIIWYVFSGEKLAPAGSACTSNGQCQSGICLPDAKPAEVDSFLELLQAYEQGRDAQPSMVGQIDDLLTQLPRSSLTLRPIYPGGCTQLCTADQDCPQHMFCIDAVWMGVIKGIDRGKVQVCMPDEHPAAKLMRRRQAHQ